MRWFPFFAQSKMPDVCLCSLLCSCSKEKRKRVEPHAKSKPNTANIPLRCHYLHLSDIKINKCVFGSLLFAVITGFFLFSLVRSLCRRMYVRKSNSCTVRRFFHCFNCNKIVSLMKRSFNRAFALPYNKLRELSC